MNPLPPYDRRLFRAVTLTYIGACLLFSTPYFRSTPAPMAGPPSAPDPFEVLSDRLPPGTDAPPVFTPDFPRSGPDAGAEERPAAPVVLPRHRPAAPPVRQPVMGPTLAADAEDNFHDAFVEITLRSDDPAHLDALRSTGPWRAWVEKDGKRVVTIGGMTQSPLVYDQGEGLFKARWPVPWNAPDGEYRLRLAEEGWPASVPRPKEGTFKVLSRPFEPVPPGFAVLTMEGYRAFERIPGPDGVKSIAGFPEWARFIGADALFVQGGESSGYDEKPKDDFPWYTTSFKGLRALGAECRRRGLKLGVYVLSYMVGGPPEFAPNYTFGWNYDDKGLRAGLSLRKRRGVSITDPKRPGDIVAMHRKFLAMPEVDWLGLDYIRPAFGSCELVDDFVAEMPGVVTPPGFDLMTPEQRMAWICRGRYSASTPAQRAEPRFILSDQWFWYRAHRTAEVVRAITGALGGAKPVWAFTLSWNKGWEHGQDPSMMRDAGVDMDSVMLYEADEKMFKGLVGHWGAYARRDQLNLIVGDTVDWPLHQKTVNPAGPESFIDRTLRAVKGFSTDGKPARGVFFHDIGRAIWGRKGPYKSMEWMLAAGHAITETRKLNGVLPYDLKVEVSTGMTPGESLPVVLSYAGGIPEEPVNIRLFAAPDLEVSAREVSLSTAAPAAEFKIRWTPNDASAERGNRSYLAFRASRPAAPEGTASPEGPAGPGEHPVIRIFYIQGTTDDQTPP